MIYAIKFSSSVLCTCINDHMHFLDDPLFWYDNGILFFLVCTLSLLETALPHLPHPIASLI